jgi:YVTN family beta-propeller protein
MGPAEEFRAVMREPRATTAFRGGNGMKGWRLAAAGFAVAALLAAAACSGNRKVVTVTIAPTTATVILGGSQQFTAAVQGTSNTSVNWSVSCSGASGSACGTITTAGLYTAPAALPSPSTNTVTVTATSAASSGSKSPATVTLDSGIRVQVAPATATVGTAERFTLTPTVTGTNIPANMTVTWTVGGVANGNTSLGQICVHNSNPCAAPTGPLPDPVDYLAPATAPSPNSLTVQATSSADTTMSGSMTMTVFAAADPAIASITPTTAAQGSVFQDVYLNATSGTDFLSTSTVLVNGTAVPTTFLSTALLRARIPANSLQVAATLAVVVERQNGDISNPENLQVVPQRPAVVAAVPRSLPQCVSSCGSASIVLDGGYYSPSTTAAFNGQPVGASVANSAQPNQLNVVLPSSALGTAGLFELAVENSGAAPGLAAINVAVEPSPPASPLLATIPVGGTPSAVAINRATGVAVVANSADNTITMFNPNTCSSSACTTTVAVGTDPTGVAIDDLRNLALVVNQGDNNLSVVDLSGVNPTQTVGLPSLPSGAAPVSVGVDPLTGHALVANARTNTATVIDDTQSPPAVLGTANVNTGGSNPQVGIEPALDWAIVTPAGSGNITAVDMSHTSINPSTNTSTFNIAFSISSISGNVTPTGTQGVAIDPETGQALFTNPSCSPGSLTCSVAFTFSLLDQTVTTVTSAPASLSAAAANPLTDVGVAVNSQTNSVSLIDLGGSAILSSPIAVGSTPVAVAVDAATNLAVVVNQGDNTVSVLSLGTIRPLHVTQLSPVLTFTSAGPLTLTILGNGFVSGSLVRLDGSTVTPTFVNSNGRELTVNVPATLLTGPRRIAVDVLNPDNSVSNAEPLTVIQAVPLGSGSAPGAVAVDPTRNLAVVANTGSNSVSVVDLATGTVVETFAVGSSPEGVAVIPRLGRAVVTNFGGNSATILDIVGDTVVSSISLGANGPIGVAMNQDTAVAAIAANTSNSLVLLGADTAVVQGSISVNQGPIATEIDPVLNLAAVADSTQNVVDLVNLGSHLIIKSLGLAPNAVFELPSGVALDPVSGAVTSACGGVPVTGACGVFLVANSLSNNLVLADPESFLLTPVRTGINPTSVAYNFQSATALTVNSASHTVSVMDYLGRHVQAILPLGGAPQQAVAVNSATNLAVVADQNDDQILLVPLP